MINVTQGGWYVIDKTAKAVVAGPFPTKDAAARSRKDYKDNATKEQNENWDLWVERLPKLTEENVATGVVKVAPQLARGPMNAAQE